MDPTPPSERILANIGRTVRDRVFIDGREFVIDRPSESHRLLDEPEVHAAFDRDEYMPYWADLWPSARMLAKVILRENWTPGIQALEIGCGLGLVGVVALSVGLRVTFSDYDACALRFAADNARVNGFDNFDTMQIDWRFPPADLRVPILLASDVIYEVRNLKPLISFIGQVLEPGGLCLLSDQNRTPADAFHECLRKSGLDFDTRTIRAGEPGGRRLKGTVYRISTPD